MESNYQSRRRSPSPGRSRCGFLGAALLAGAYRCPDRIAESAQRLYGATARRIFPNPHVAGFQDRSLDAKIELSAFEAYCVIGGSTPGRRSLYAHLRTRITPDDRKLEVRIFLAALATGASVSGAAKVAGLLERRIVRWVAFNGFFAAVEEARSRGGRTKHDRFGVDASKALIELNDALADRSEQQSADRYADGDRERLHKMRMSGELQAIHDREAIANLRRHGKHDLADHYERLMADAQPLRPIDYVGEAVRSLSLE